MAKKYEINTWFERDRSFVELTKNGKSILEFWDNDVTELIEAGFINPKNYLRSMIDYARYLGLIDRISREI